MVSTITDNIIHSTSLAESLPTQSITSSSEIVTLTPSQDTMNTSVSTIENNIPLLATSSILSVVATSAHASTATSSPTSTSTQLENVIVLVAVVPVLVVLFITMIAVILVVITFFIWRRRRSIKSSHIVQHSVSNSNEQVDVQQNACYATTHNHGTDEQQQTELDAAAMLDNDDNNSCTTIEVGDFAEAEQEQSDRSSIVLHQNGAYSSQIQLQQNWCHVTSNSFSEHQQ